MARGDKSGPMGQGPMIGRGLGYCAGYDSPGFTRGFGGGSGFGGGMRRNRGMRFRHGFGFNVQGSDRPVENINNEINSLRVQVESLKQAQQEIERRLNDLENR